MKRISKIICCVFLTLSAILGWFNRGVNTANLGKSTDSWTRLKQIQTPSINVMQINKNLKAMDVFPLTGEQSDSVIGLDGQPITENSDRPPFPKIINVSYLDNKAQLVLLLEDNLLIEAYAEDTLSSGWKVKEVDLTHVIAVFDGEEQEFPVTEYDNRQKDTDGTSEQGSEDL